MRRAPTTHLNAQGYVSDPNASAALTDYFKHHRLPLVGAQVLRNPNDGARAVVLYGFVGSDFGKSDAQRQAEDFINDASVDVDNRIRVNPDLLTARTPAGAASPDADDPDAQEQANANASMPGVQNYVDQQNQASQLQQYQQQNSMSGMNSMMPLIALLGILSMEMAATGGGYSSGPHFGYSSPYGTSPVRFALQPVSRLRVARPLALRLSQPRLWFCGRLQFARRRWSYALRFVAGKSLLLVSVVLDRYSIHDDRWRNRDAIATSSHRRTRGCRRPGASALPSRRSVLPPASRSSAGY